MNNFVDEIQKVRSVEKEIALTNSKNSIAFTKKQHLINNIIP